MQRVVSLPIVLRASGRQRDIDQLYSRLVPHYPQWTRNLYEIEREKYRLTARWEFGSLPFEQIRQMSRELPWLYLAVTWRFDRHQVGYCIYGAGVEELLDVEQISGRLHADRLWKRANDIAEGHVMRRCTLPG